MVVSFISTFYGQLGLNVEEESSEVGKGLRFEPLHPSPLRICQRMVHWDLYLGI